MTSTELVDCTSLAPGARVAVETKNRQYQIEFLGGNAIRICGHPEYCPTPVTGELQGSSDKAGVLEAGLIGCGRHMKFLVEDRRPVTTSKVLSSSVKSSRVGNGMSDIKFEDALQRLEEIVDRLETGELPLEDSLKVFEEGVALARRCSKYLEEAEKRIELLTKDEGGLLRTEPFEWDKDGQG